MKIFTFNIHKGFNWSNQQLTLRSLKKSLTEVHPDIVFLQEVVGENIEQSQKNPEWIENQFEFLADELWDEFAYAKNAVYDQRHHGNVILSKYPIIKKEVINISTNTFEQRGILFCEIQLPNEILHCYCVHLNLTHQGRIKQYDFIKEVINKNSNQDEKIILAGDFNDWNQKASSFLLDCIDLHEAHKLLHGEYAKTYPAKLPLLRLDRMYLRRVKLKDISVLKGKPWNEYSDHLPLIAEVEL